MVLKSRPLTTLQMIKGQGWILKRMVFFAYFCLLSQWTPHKGILKLFHFFLNQTNPAILCEETSRNLPEPREFHGTLAAGRDFMAFTISFRTSDIKINNLHLKKTVKICCKKSYQGPSCWVERICIISKKCILQKGVGPYAPSIGIYIISRAASSHHPTRIPNKRGTSEGWAVEPDGRCKCFGDRPGSRCRKSSSWEAGKNTDSLEIS